MIPPTCIKTCIYYAKIIAETAMLAAVIELIHGAMTAEIKQYCHFSCCVFTLHEAILKVTERHALENGADWCNMFIQNYHGKLIGDKNDSWAITAEAVMGCCNLNDLLE